MLAHWARCTHKFFGFSCQNGALLKCSGAVALSCVVERDADSPRSKKAKGVCALPVRQTCPSDEWGANVCLQGTGCTSTCPYSRAAFLHRLEMTRCDVTPGNAKLGHRSVSVCVLVRLDHVSY